MADPRLQRRLRFWMRAFIACWILSYGLVKNDTFLLHFYQQIIAEPAFSGLPKLVFVWLTALVCFLPIAAGHWFFTRSTPDPETDAWRDIT